jgi:hypothetical protein
MREECIYGFPCVEDPNDFTPDYECCTEQEVANWKAACEAWNRGERGTETVTNKGCFVGQDGDNFVHVTRTSWGIGVNVVKFDDDGEFL